MSSPTTTSVFAAIGFGIEFIRNVIESGIPKMESFYNGAIGALGALAVKVLYDIIMWVIKKKKQNNENKIK